MNIVFKELIVSGVEVEDSQEAIKKVGQYLFDNGFVKETYISAVLEREKVYPTGLQLKNIGIAMPHTDSQHVHKSGICIAKLVKPVVFEHMGMPGTQVEAEMLFMMSISDSKEQVDNLQKILKMFSNEQAAEDFRNAQSTEEIYAVAVKYLE